MNKNQSSNVISTVISNDRLSIYNNGTSNLSYSPAQNKQGVLKVSDTPGRFTDGVSLEEINKATNVNDGRNASIQKNEILYTIAQYISNSVYIMFISTFISLIVLKDKKWLYILLIVFIVNILLLLLKIFFIRFDYEFLHRPGKCMDEHMVRDFLESSFVLEELKKKVNIEHYNTIGLPSLHTTRAALILTLTYLFFPKYKKITMTVAPIYLLLLSWARMYLDCHTLLQTMAGIILGVLAGKVSFNLCN